MSGWRWPEIRQALADMQAVADSVAGRATVNFDLSDLRGNGVSHR